MKQLQTLLVLISLLLAACGGTTATPTPDLEATVQAAIAATQAAQPTDTPVPEPTATPQPTDTPMPTDTPAPTDTPVPTDTPTLKPTDTPGPTPTPTETPLPTDTPTPEPTDTATPIPPTPTPTPALLVEFRNLHYECTGGAVWYAGRLNNAPFSGYRRFQADFFIKNLGTEPIIPPWMPTRWIVTNGVDEHELTYMWQWVPRSRQLYEQPVIQPLASAGWTYMAYPLEQGEWVKAAEFEYNGVTYRQEFDLGDFGDAHNYVACP